MNTPIKQPSIFDYWVLPDCKIREGQKIGLEWLQEQLAQNKKYFLFEAPVGSGKSALAVTAANYMKPEGKGTSYLLTPQRVLQRQYEHSFPSQSLVSVYGKANYYCKTKVGLNCDIADDIKPKCLTCPARLAFDQIEINQHAVLSYRLGLLYAELYPSHNDRFPIKDLMVLDECHSLESQLVNHKTINISESRCTDINVVYVMPTDLQSAHQWLQQEYYPALDSYYFELSKTVKAIQEKYEYAPENVTAADLKSIRECKEISRHRELIKNLVSRSFESIERSYVLMKDKKKFQIKDVYGKNLFRNLLVPKADKFLFMSSTILNFDAYCKDLGIPVEESVSISLPSEFDPENRPVVFIPTTKMAYGWDKDENKSKRDSMAKRVIELCDLHKEDSGVVHTGNFKITSWLIGEIKDKIPHQIITHQSDQNLARDEMIEEFIDNAGKTPMLLISPSITEGLDLVDDIARFAIFVKVPYLQLNDEWVKRRLELSQEWYNRQAFQSIIQGSGRIVRSEDDWGNTYILDESFRYLWNTYKKYVPKWWKDSFSILK